MRPLEPLSISVLVGQTLTDVIGSVGDEEVTFTTATGAMYRLHHDQDCCESVLVEDITGELADLIGSPITQAEESSNEIDTSAESGTWTFYRLGTANGSVVIRWLGVSNGYYSESVDFSMVTP